MRKILSTIKTFTKNEDGAALAEYAVILAVVLGVALVGLTAIGTNAGALFTAAAAKMTGFN